jgi:hypothetical protein
MVTAVAIDETKERFREFDYRVELNSRSAALGSSAVAVRQKSNRIDDISLSCQALISRMSEVIK